MAHKWEFSRRFRRNAFGWRSQLPIKRIKEALSEIRGVARKDPALAAEGAVLFLEKLSPAIENVDSSSGAIGTATNRAVEALVEIMAEAPADASTRSNWLKRLWTAVEEDGIGYLDQIPEHWGKLCASQTMASYWADAFIGAVRIVWGPGSPGGGFYNGTAACLSSLHHSGRYAEILELLDLSPDQSWYYRKWGTMALAAMGRNDDAIQYAFSTLDAGMNNRDFTQTCEEILLAQGKTEQAFARFALHANRRNTNLATFNSIKSKYPDKTAKDILAHVVDESPGEEGKWFAAAKSAGLLKEAVSLAEEYPCDPVTLTRAAKGFLDRNPEFALKVGYAAVRWLLAGYGRDISPTDVMASCMVTLLAGVRTGCSTEIRERIGRLTEAPFLDGCYTALLVQTCLKHWDERLSRS
jgi:hypothetical protein